MRILHLIYDHPQNPWVGGGGAVRAWEVCRRLASSGHDITMLCGAYPGASDRTEDRIDLRFIGSGSSYRKSTFSYAFKAAGFLRGHGSEFDIVVEDFAPWNPVFTTLMTRIPSVLHINHREGTNILKRFSVAGLPFFLIEMFYHRMFRNVASLSEGTRERIGRPDAFLHPAGINTELYEQGLDGVSDNERLIAYVGRLEINNKGLDTLMKAMPKINNARLAMAGKGRDESELVRMAQGLPVDFLGFVSEEEKHALLKRASLLVLPSRFEGWGIVTLEAAACAKPVVVSDIPELGYATVAGFGCAFRTGDAGGLADAVNYLLDNPEACNEMGTRAREFASKHTWDRIADEFEQYLKGIIKADN
ncbi:glycosyltransferase family 4 protein [Nitrospirota bacterium]